MDAIFVNYSDEEIWKANKKPPLHLNKENVKKKIISEVFRSILLHKNNFLYPGGKPNTVNSLASGNLGNWKKCPLVVLSVYENYSHKKKEEGKKVERCIEDSVCE